MVAIQTGQSGMTVLRHVEMGFLQGAVSVTTQRLQDLMQKIVQVWGQVKKQRNAT